MLAYKEPILTLSSMFLLYTIVSTLQQRLGFLTLKAVEIDFILIHTD